MAEAKTLFEDEVVFVIHKPAGIHSVAHTEDEETPSIAADLLDRSPHLREVADRPGDAGLINRLDFSTSGILIGAKTRAVWQTLRGDIHEGRIQKRYLAVVEGVPPEETTLENFIGSPYRRSQKVRVYESLPPGGRALPARSTFSRRESNTLHDVSLVEVEAPTARRHQIRVHARTLGHPLVGDKLYGSTRRLDELFPGVGSSEFCLHAFQVEFLHPLTQAPIRIFDQPPDYLREIFRLSVS